MEGLFVVAALVVMFFVLRHMFGGARGFDDPKPMSNEHLLSAIAGQADWLEKMSRSPFETQQTASIKELARKRRDYIAQLCLEVLSRGDSEGKVFWEATSKARELEAIGVSKEKAAVQSVKKELFAASGVLYSASWEN